MSKLTVFTPTYNREELLPRLYHSLCMQTNMNFEWIVVDDGSTDNTEKLIKTWIDENVINIVALCLRNPISYSVQNIS